MWRRGKIAVASFVAMLLAIFGITQIGGDTWVTASAPLADGFMRARTPLPVEHSGFRGVVPVIMLVALAVGAVAHAYFTRPAEDSSEQ